MLNRPWFLPRSVVLGIVVHLLCSEYFGTISTVIQLNNNTTIPAHNHEKKAKNFHPNTFHIPGCSRYTWGMPPEAWAWAAHVDFLRRGFVNSRVFVICIVLIQFKDGSVIFSEAHFWPQASKVNAEFFRLQRAFGGTLWWELAKWRWRGNALWYNKTTVLRQIQNCNYVKHNLSNSNSE